MAKKGIPCIRQVALKIKLHLVHIGIPFRKLVVGPYVFTDMQEIANFHLTPDFLLTLSDHRLHQGFRFLLSAAREQIEIPK